MTIAANPSIVKERTIGSDFQYAESCQQQNIHCQKTCKQLSCHFFMRGILRGDPQGRGWSRTPILTPLSGIYRVSTDGIAGFQIYWNFHLIGSKWIVLPKITFEYIRFKLHEANIWSSPLWNGTPCIVPNKNFAVVKIQFRFCCYGRLNHIFQI